MNTPFNEKNPEKRPNNTVRLEPFIDISSVKFPVADGGQNPKIKEDGGVLIPVLVSIAVILILLVTVLIFMW